MKILTLIFAFLILALSSFPCSDRVNENTDTIQAENHSDHSEGDVCTPFCICACCGIALSFEVLIFENENLNITVNSHTFNYKTKFTQGYNASIWHPPTVS